MSGRVVEVYVSNCRGYVAIVLDDEETIIVVDVDNEAHGDQVGHLDETWQLISEFDDHTGTGPTWSPL